MSTTYYSNCFSKLWKELPTKETHEKPNLNRKITPYMPKQLINVCMFE